MVELLIAMAAIVAYWIVLLALFSGIGLLVRRSFGLTSIHAEGILLAFWMGWAVTLGGLHLWHFWLPVDWRAFLVFAGIGLLGIWHWRRNLWCWLRPSLHHSWRVYLLLVVIAFWIANHAVGSLTWGDTGLYHFNAVRWNVTYPLVPGLGNLHGRLAFNNAHFLYAALLEIGPWLHQSRHLANGLLLLLLAAHIVLSVAKLQIAEPHWRGYYLLHLLLLAPLCIQVGGDGTSSLSTDLPIFVLGIILTTRLYAFLLMLNEHSSECAYELLLIIILAAVGITIKLNFIAQGGTAVLIAVLTWLFGYHSRAWSVWKPLVWGGCGGALLVLVWMVRGIGLSGFPLYPSTVGGMPVDWRMPLSSAKSESLSIQSWARRPSMPPSEVLSSWDWLTSWLLNLPGDVTIPAAIAFFATLFLVVTPVRQASVRRRVWLLLLPILAGLVFWFTSAPDPRFAGAGFWLLAVVTLTMTFDVLVPEHLLVVPLAFLFGLGIFLGLSPVRKPVLTAPAPVAEGGGVPKSPTVDLVTFYIDGVNIYVPRTGDWCWDAPLPCTPYFRTTMHLREPGNLRKGFRTGEQLSDPAVALRAEFDGLIEVAPEFVVSPDLQVGLSRTTWHRFEQATNARWMVSPGYILVHSEQATGGLMRLTPWGMNVHDDFGASGVLTVTVNHEPGEVLPVATDVDNAVPLQLLPGWNVIKLALAAGNYVPGGNDLRTLSIAFRPITITTDVQLAIPPGVTAAEGMGVVLGSGWYNYEPGNGIRWMKNPGQLWVYADEAHATRLTVVPWGMNVNEDFGQAGQLAVTVNDRVPTKMAVATGKASFVTLPLLAGWNRVELNLVAGNYHPKNGDTRILSIAFYALDLALVE